MRSRTGITLIGFLIIAFLGLPIVVQAAIAQDGDPGSIGWCLSNKADGQSVTVTCEQVMWRGVSGKSFAIKEATEGGSKGRPRILVVSRQSLPVKSNWTVDVTGTLQTLRTATTEQRVIITSPSQVYVYCTDSGIPSPPVFRGWDLSGTIKKTLAQLAPQGVTTMAMTTMSEGGELPPGDDPPPPPDPPAPGSKDSLKHLPDGASVSVNGAIVSASFSDYGFFYVEKSDRSFGIWISSNTWVPEGQLVDITGRMSTGGGERAVVADQDGVTLLDAYTYPRPREVGLCNRDLGGGAVLPFTPPVGKRGDADNSGLNNTGLLVRAWGKVTAVDGQYPIYWIDDGSNVAADGENIGVKVYDLSYGTLPSVNDYVTLSGVSAAEWPEGSDSSIRVIWKTDSVPVSTQSGSGTISGTITATGANGKTVRVYCATASTTATFSGNTASYTLPVRYGSHAVTATLLGYKTTTQLATVSSGTPVTLNFTLPALQRRIDVIASPWRIPPDGVSQMTIMAIVRDEEGRRFGNEAVTWSADIGTVISSDSTTDAVGEARLVLQAPTNADTGGVYVTCGGTQGVGYAEFGSATAPSVRILTPTNNQTVSGTTTIEVEAWDYAGTQPGIVHIGVAADGQPLMPLLVSNKTGYWATYEVPNGTHHIKAAATDFDNEAGFSQIVTLNVNNPAYSVAETSSVINASNPTTTISATLVTSANWTVEIAEPNASTPLQTYSGSGTAVSATWDGKASDQSDVPSGTYEYNIKSNGNSLAKNKVAVWRGSGGATALIVEGYNFPYNASEMNEVAKQCRKRGFNVITIPQRIATWQNFLNAYNTYSVQVLFVTSHGEYEIRNQDCNPSLLPQITGFMLKDSMVYSYRPQDGYGYYFMEYPAPGDPAFADLGTNFGTPPWNNFPALKAHYVSEIPYYRRDDMTFVWMDTCFCGRIGAGRGDLTDQGNPYNIVDYNDMASMFYIYDNAYTYGACYAGYYEQSMSDAHYDRLVGIIFGSLGWGYTMDQAVWRDAYGYGGFVTGVYDPSYTEQDGPCGIWRVAMPPYHNLRVHGNPYGFRLSPH